MSTQTNKLYPDAPHNTYESGKRFEEFVTDLLKRAFNINLEIHQTYSGQINYGECRQRIEIKEDRLWSNTGRLSIEIAERKSQHHPWRESGVYTPDHWLYAQGNYTGLWLFISNNLRYIHEFVKQFPDKAAKLGLYEKEELTIRTFYLPVSVAQNYGYFLPASGWTIHPMSKFTDICKEQF